MLKLTFYVPVDFAEQVKKALFEAGAGRLGDYDNCSFEIEGVGQFRALKGANPTVGKINQIEKILETRVEMVLEDHILIDVIKALKSFHPYETPAFDVVKCMEV